MYTHSTCLTEIINVYGLYEYRVTYCKVMAGVETTWAPADIGNRSLPLRSMSRRRSRLLELMPYTYTCRSI